MLLMHQKSELKAQGLIAWDNALYFSVNTNFLCDPIPLRVIQMILIFRQSWQLHPISYCSSNLKSIRNKDKDFSVFFHLIDEKNYLNFPNKLLQSFGMCYEPARTS